MTINRHHYPADWLQISFCLRAAFEWTCEGCGQTPSRHDTHVDHFDGDPLNLDPSNLTVLCPSCHAQKEWLRWRGHLSSRQQMVKTLRYRANLRATQLRLPL